MKLLQQLMKTTRVQEVTKIKDQEGRKNMKKPTRIEILNEMEKLEHDEACFAYEAFEIGEILQGEYGGYCAAFAAGMLYAKKLFIASVENK